MRKFGAEWANCKSLTAAQTTRATMKRLSHKHFFRSSFLWNGHRLLCDFMSFLERTSVFGYSNGFCGVWKIGYRFFKTFEVKTFNLIFFKFIPISKLHNYFLLNIVYFGNSFSRWAIAFFKRQTLASLFLVVRRDLFIRAFARWVALYSFVGVLFFNHVTFNMVWKIRWRKGLFFRIIVAHKLKNLHI